MTTPIYDQTDPNAPQPQPVAVHTAIVTVLGAVIATLWGVSPDSTLLNTVASVVAGITALISMLMARARVTPTDSPRNDAGQPLVPSATSG